MPQLKVNLSAIFFFVFASLTSLSVYSQTQISDANHNTFSKSKSDYDYTDVLYTGFTYDLDAKHSNKGAWAIAIGYRRMFDVYKKWGVNILTSVNCFYNASEDLTNSQPAYIESKKLDYTRNYFSINVHAAPSYSFSDQFILYGGIGVTYLQAKEFYYGYYNNNPYYTYYGASLPNAFENMFSKVIGVELSPSGKFAMNMEYVNTRANNFVSIKAGMRF